mmetsp:Transcript_14739/g.43246  ORF Transcript_14739/g.43246 Transcript_14739/m.43246 type:complete len:224 (-) Transcript_14739:1721-2392(-)
MGVGHGTHVGESEPKVCTQRRTVKAQSLPLQLAGHARAATAISLMRSREDPEDMRWGLLAARGVAFRIPSGATWSRDVFAIAPCRKRQRARCGAVRATSSVRRDPRASALLSPWTGRAYASPRATCASRERIRDTMRAAASPAARTMPAVAARACMPVPTFAADASPASAGKGTPAMRAAITSRRRATVAVGAWPYCCKLRCGHPLVPQVRTVGGGVVPWQTR